MLLSIDANNIKKGTVFSLHCVQGDTNILEYKYLCVYITFECRHFFFKYCLSFNDGR